MDSASRDCILVVDDSQENLDFIQAILEPVGYQLALAKDGKTALEKLETVQPQLVLSDVLMPRMDGVELTRQIRKRTQDSVYIPILLITAQESSDVVEGLDAGADDFIRKPVEVDELLARVRSLLRLKHSIDKQAQMMHQIEDFVSRLTHDLRTPLVAAERMLELFQQESFGPLTPEMAEGLQLLWTNNNNLMQLTNTLLEVYRYESERKILNFSPLNLKELLQEVLQELRPLADEKQLSIQIQLNSLIASGVRLELYRVFTNLIGNAIKFTEQGSITVELERSPNEDGIEINITDTGMGVSPEDQAVLFSRFRQGKHSKAGSGLGLYLSRQIIQAHGGSLSVHSALGEGSTFTIWLPSANV
ncbi:MAG: hybrid sensor histidine kinase/response regulator [Leptolyngbyaceae cyanobacterium MO_188.B28]|nr:hybrid sensor histidine kinase/response regulator [Leptolyngbyaceae cyanobacterium MO_188.B28]